ncbi:MAG: sulfotransferase domain-containing protein [Deltaproteobacteria bacterium]|nr:sulfotransferase domain-containing protein [Candidatus Zymogenaceae bacterium]
MMEPIIVVSGLPRSGTSLMMRMLKAGGVEIVTDDIRRANIDNPKGYFEYERVKTLPTDNSWVKELSGRAVKVISFLLRHLPEGLEYRVIFMRRNLEEVLMSQNTMLVHRGKEPGDDDGEMMSEFAEHLEKTFSLIESRPEMKVLYVDYSSAIEDPEGCVIQVSEFLGREMDEAACRKAVDPELYRNRVE